jgi:2-methylcitrate dehydratase PrpD
MAAGLVANFGSMTKPLQVGLAARHGLLAARLAERGVTATADALESPRGFLAAISPRGQVDLHRPCAAGQDGIWQIERQGLNIKRYPVCYALHRAVDAALSLHPVLLAQPPDRIVRVEVILGRLQAAMLRSSRPTTGLDAKFSAEYAIACGLTHGRLGLSDLTDEAVNRAEIQALLRRVQVTPDDATDPDESLFSPADKLLVTLDDGCVLQAEPVRRALGHAARPIDDAALRAKFIDCGGTEGWWQALMAGDDNAPLQWPGRACPGNAKHTSCASHASHPSHANVVACTAS